MAIASVIPSALTVVFTVSTTMGWGLDRLTHVGLPPFVNGMARAGHNVAYQVSEE